MMTQPPGRRARPGWTSAGAAIGGLAVVALALLLVPGWIAPQAPSPGPATPSPSVAVSFPPSAYRSVEWQVAPMGAGSDGATVNVFGVAGERIVAVGIRGTQPLAWWSDDGGETWKAAAMAAPAEVPVAGAYALPLTLAASGTRAVATGYWVSQDHEILGPVAWVSPDGRSWQAVDLRSSISAMMLERVVAMPDAFYALGRGVGTSIAWWRSTDGQVWLPVDFAGLPLSTAIVGSAIGGTGGQLVVAGGEGIGPRAHASVWVGDEQLRFERVYSDQEAWGSIRGIARADYGYVGVGETLDDPEDQTRSHLAAWISPDGRHWARLGLDSPVGSATAGVAANAAGAVILGAEAGTRTAEAWFLPGGSGSPARTGLPIAVWRIVALPDRFIVMGGCLQASPCAGPMVAIGRPSEAFEAPAPTLPPGVVLSPAPSGTVAVPRDS